ncbi:helix-turn-helix domain-containing protein [Saccharopolyspora sp. NPDC003752]
MVDGLIWEDGRFGGGGNSFGVLLRRLRIAAGLTQEGLAEQSGLSVRTISDLERDKTSRPQRSSVRLLARTLGLEREQAEEFHRTAHAPFLGRPGSAARVGAASNTAGGAQRRHDVFSELPADVPFFIGRLQVLRRLCATLAPDASMAADRPRIVNITGAPGAGKTALGVHVAHRLKDQFSDGHIYVDLQFKDGSGVCTDEIPSRILRSLGARSVPAGLEEQCALLRALLASRQVFLLLDGVVDEAQVRPLLPGVGRSVVVLISHRKLHAIDCRWSVRVPGFTNRESRDYLAGLFGTDRMAADSEGVRELVACCAGNPLALRIAGSLLAARPYVQPRDLAALLADPRKRLDHLVIGDLSVRDSVRKGYNNLTPDQRSGLQALSRVSPNAITYTEIPALLGRPAYESRALLADLVDAGLVHTNGVAAGSALKYRVDDFMRSYVLGHCEMLDAG